MADNKFISTNKVIKTLWSDSKMHKVSLGSDPNELIDIQKDLLDFMKDIKEKNEEQCRAIFHLGAALTGYDETARAFLMGWLCHAIKDGIQTKNNTKINIYHEVEDVTDEEVRDWVSEGLASLSKKIKDGDIKPKSGPLPRVDDQETDQY